MRWRTLCAALVATLALALVGGEVAARHLGLGDPPLSVADPQIEYLFRPGVYHRFGRTIRYNSFSMRSPELAPRKVDPRELRIMIFGDSVVNGGSPTDDSELATTLLAQRLHRRMARPVFVGNISAGSWGPPNHAAYLRRYGYFDADAVVLVYSGHDGADAPTFEPIVGVLPEYPDTKPALAIIEGITRYSFLSRLIASKPPPTAALPIELKREQCHDAILQIVEGARMRRIPIGIALYKARYELEKGPDANAGVILRTAEEAQVPFLDLEAAQRRAMGRESIFREGDEIHPNAAGQRVLSAELEEFLLQMLSDFESRGPQ